MVTSTEENYLKAIYGLSLNRDGRELGTNELAGQLGISPATVTSMLKKLKEKKYVNYKRYGGISLLDEGERIAISVIRRHRLWETFLVDRMNFSWDEIHDVAEQLEHIRSPKLIDELDKLLGYPDFDPHGEPIPKVNGETKASHKTRLIDAKLNKTYKVLAVNDDSADFLRYATELGLAIDVEVTINHRHEFDGSMHVEIGGKEKTISPKVAENIFVG